MFTIPRYLLCVLFALFAVLPALADVEYGLIQGTVKYDDGLMCGRATLTAKAANKTFPFATEPDGTFSGIVPVGNVTFTVNGTSTRAQILPGQVNKVVLTAKRPGWIVKIVSPDGAPAEMAWVNAAYKAPAAPAKKGTRPANGNRGGIGGMRLTTGRYWFPQIPANATAFAIIGAQGQGSATTYYRTQWQFTTPASKRTLSMTVKRSAQLWLSITEETDKPLPGVSVHGSLAFQVSVRPRDYWSTTALPVQSARQNITGGKTDARGAINLGCWPVGKYAVSLVAGDHAGRPLSVEIKPDGTVTQKTYRASLRPRSVTQTVFTTAGAPAAHATVYASFYWGSAACLRTAQADAQGQVVWSDLPPVRTITWGETIRPGVIPCEGDAFPAPLPAPTAQGWTTLCFKVINPGGGNARTIASIQGERIRDGMSNFDEMEGQQARREEVTEWKTRVICGTPFTLRWLTISSTTQCSYLPGVYAPYVDTDQPVDYPLELQEGAEIHGRFVDQNGTKIAGVSRLRVTLLKPANAAFSTELFTASPGDDYNGDWLTELLPALQTPKELADGSFTMQTLVPGTYRVLVDLYDASSPTPPGCVLDVKPGKNDFTITLPEPLFTVPAGTNVQWLTHTAPALSQELRVAAHALTMPVYGPRESLLACWYQASPNKLEIWDWADGSKRQRTLSLRASYFTVPGMTEDLSMPRDISYSLYPMLPTLSRQDQRYVEDYDGQARRLHPAITATESSSAVLRSPFTAQRFDLWSGAYLLDTGKGLAKFDVPEGGDPQIALPLSLDDVRDRAANGGEPTKSVRLMLPRIDYNAVRKTSANSGMILADVSFHNSENYSNDFWGNPGEWVNVPAETTTITLQWLGMGVARDLKIPHAVDQQTPIVSVREWSPGLHVNGTVLRADGKPFAHGQLMAMLSGDNGNSSHSMRLKTDANGKFSMKGLLPGPLFIWNESSSAGWSLNVPENGLDHVILRLAQEPVRVQLYNYSYSGQAVAWWLPDGGKPYLLPKRWSECGAYDVPTGSGWLWIIDNTTGRSSCTRQLLVQGRNNIVPQLTEGPSLGIEFPLDAKMELPGMVTLIGQGERAGLTIAFPNFGWAPSALLQLVTGQIDAVPPGTYKLQVATPHGRVESLVTVTESGCSVKLTMPPAPEDTALADIAAR